MLVVDDILMFPLRSIFFLFKEIEDQFHVIFDFKPILIKFWE